MIVNSKFTLYSHAPILIGHDEKLSVKASNSLPEFYQEEFPTFQEFIDVYYHYMSKRTPGFKTMNSMKDIDEVGKKYLQAFYKMYANDIPEFPYISMVDFIRNSKAFYISRGSEESFRFLFKIMFGQEIDMKYPRENIFAPSIGKWNQRVSIYVEIEHGTLNESIIGKKLLIRATDGSTSSFLVKNIITLGSNFFEVEVDNFIKQNVIGGAKIFAFYNAETKQYNLRGQVKLGLNNFKIVDPGTDFKPGQVFNITSPDGEISFRISAVDEDNGIKKIEFIEFAGISESNFTVLVESATIEFTLGAINTYTGYYENTDGFLSNQSKLEDNFFYQIFSYVIKSRVSRELYIDIIEKLLHPSGLISFSEFEAGSEYVITLLTVSDTNTSISSLDAINIHEEFEKKIKSFRAVSDTLNISDTVGWSLKRFFNDTFLIHDEGSLQLTKAGKYVASGYTDGELYTTDQLINRNWYIDKFVELGYTTPDAYTE